jgi:hypothetical protein
MFFWNEKNMGSAVIESADESCDGQYRWTFKLNTAKESVGPHTLVLRSDVKVVRASNIMVGEVLVCEGQSNMVWPIMKTEDVDQARPDKYIRALTFSGLDSGCYQDYDIEWKEGTKENRQEMSSVCFHAASVLRKRWKVPVGMVVTALGGRAIDNFLPEDGEVYRKHSRNLKGLSIRGLAFYQGESDTFPDLAPVYRNKLMRLIEFYRSNLKPVGSKNVIPIAIVQIAGPWLEIVEDKMDQYVNVVQQAQAQVAETFETCLKLIDATKLTPDISELHPVKGKADIGRAIGRFFTTNSREC